MSNLEDYDPYYDGEQIVVIKTLVYTGKRDWIEGTLKRSYVRPDAPFECDHGTITAIVNEVKS
jgi:hypothetical protein